jgi:erythromycin esterase-like protein
MAAPILVLVDRMRNSFAVGVVALLLATGVSGATRRLPAVAVSDTDMVVHDACGKTVALLGEPPMHGYARTLQFKVELVRRLVDECHYNAFFIESGIYDFLNIQKKLSAGQHVTPDMIAAAIGGLWANHEAEALVQFLAERAQKGAVVLGGLDDQIGRGTYAQQEMSSDLSDHLQGEAKTHCLSILRRHMLWQ